MTTNMLHAAITAGVVFMMMLIAYQRGESARVPYDDTKLMETLRKQDETIRYQADTITKQDSVIQQQSKVLREQYTLLNSVHR